MHKQLRVLILAAGVALTTACGATVATGGPVRAWPSPPPPRRPVPSRSR